MFAARGVGLKRFQHPTTALCGRHLGRVEELDAPAAVNETESSPNHPEVIHQSP